MNMLKNFFLNQKIKYLISGGVAFLTENILFYLIIILFDEVKIINNIAQTTSMVVGAIVSFMLNKLWSFNNREKNIMQIIRYIIVFGFNLFFTNFVMYIVSNNISVKYLMIIKFGLVILTTLWNFFLYKYFVYREGKS